MQLTTYSKLIGVAQDRTPTEMHVQLGNNEKVSLRVADFVHYHSIAQRRLETFANQPPEVSTGEPCGHCRILPRVGSLQGPRRHPGARPPIHGWYDRMVPFEVSIAILNHIDNSRLVLRQQLRHWAPFDGCTSKFVATSS